MDTKITHEQEQQILIDIVQLLCQTFSNENKVFIYEQDPIKANEYKHYFQHYTASLELSFLQQINLFCDKKELAFLKKNIKKKIPVINVNDDFYQQLFTFGKSGDVAIITSSIPYIDILAKAMNIATISFIPDIKADINLPIKNIKYIIDIIGNIIDTVLSDESVDLNNRQDISNIIDNMRVTC